MIHYLSRGLDGCWHWVTTDLATWARLPHLAAAVVLACTPVQHPHTAWIPGSVYYPPHAAPAGPDDVAKRIPVHYVPRDDDDDHPVKVPEPATLAVFGIGIAGLVIVRRRKA